MLTDLKQRDDIHESSHREWHSFAALLTYLWVT
jgi:hypothetical protein